MRFIAKINGKKHLNGEEYGVTILGSADMVPGFKQLSIYKVVSRVAQHLEDENAEMEHPESIQITLTP